MTNLDPRSMIALAGFMSAVMALVLLFMRRHYPPSIRGVGGWAAAPLLWLLSTVLFCARGAIPDWLGLVLANQLLVLGSVTYYMGTRQVMGQPATWRPRHWVMAGTTAFHAAPRGAQLPGAAGGGDAGPAHAGTGGEAGFDTGRARGQRPDGAIAVPDPVHRCLRAHRTDVVHRRGADGHRPLAHRAGAPGHL